MNEKWDNRFLRLAEHIASWSRDPSTQTGAVIVRPNKTIASVGFNGFARGMRDDKDLYAERDIKYHRIIHCEMNAILSAAENLHGYTLYTWPFMSCQRCAVHVIQTGIVRHVAPALPEYLKERWGYACEAAMKCFEEARVTVCLL